MEHIPGLKKTITACLIVLKNPAQEEGVESVLFIWFSYKRNIGGVQFGI